jgi:hypothetical protein
MESIIGLKSILGWEQLPLFGRYGYVEMIKCLTIKTLPFCRLSTELLVLSVCGRLCNARRIMAFIRRYVHDEGMTNRPSTFAYVAFRSRRDTVEGI